MTLLLLALVALLAYANGSNDNSKGVATSSAMVRRRPAGVALCRADYRSRRGGLILAFRRIAEKLQHRPVRQRNRRTGYRLLHRRADRRIRVGHLCDLHGAAGLDDTCDSWIAHRRGTRGRWQRPGAMAVLGKSFVLPLVLSPVLSLTLVYLLAGRWFGSSGKWPSRKSLASSSSRWLRWE